MPAGATFSAFWSTVEALNSFTNSAIVVLLSSQFHAKCYLKISGIEGKEEAVSGL
jgi:hypothetical protein